MSASTLIMTDESPLLKTMSIILTASVTARENGFLATISDGRRIVSTEIRNLALALYEMGLCVDTVHCADWREGEIAPSAGSAIALKAELRRLCTEPKTSETTQQQTSDQIWWNQMLDNITRMSTDEEYRQQIGRKLF